jgi:hypothetical protein
VAVVIEATLASKRRLQRILTGMAERRMADIVCETQRLGEVLVQRQGPRDRPADLRDLEAVRQADAKVIAVGGHEHLGLVAQATEADRVDDPVAVALESIAGATDGPVLFLVKPSFAARRVRCPGRTVAHLAGSFVMISPGSLVKVNVGTPSLAS